MRSLIASYHGRNPGCRFLEAEREDRLTRELLRDDDRRCGEVPLRLHEGRAADIPLIVAAEIGAIRGVEGLEEELQAGTLANAEHLAKAHVELEERLTAQAVEGSRVACAAGETRADRRRVVALGRRIVIRIAVQQHGVFGSARRAVTEIIDALNRGVGPG